MAGYDDFSSPVASSSSASAYDAFSSVAPLAQPQTFQKPEDEKLYRQNLEAVKAERAKPQVPFYSEGPQGEVNVTATEAKLPPEQLAIQRTQSQRAKEQAADSFRGLENAAPACRRSWCLCRLGSYSRRHSGRVWPR